MIDYKAIEKIDNLKAEIANLLPLSASVEQAYWQKLRLEWNYHSNHIEGNTLTYGETKLLLLFDKTTGNHTKREYDEMEAHDVAIKMIKDWANEDQRNLTEKDIRELNKIILVKPFWKDAITHDGQSTRRKIIPGEYKQFPNHVLLSNGEIFMYTNPEDVPPQMEELVSWYNEQNNLHPIEKAARFHYRFVRIHPFDDGNGRLARLLMNYHLLKNGYAPVVIKTDDKSNYLFALNQADAGNIEAFINYIIGESLWSMNLLLKASKGEPIEEDEDWKKEIAIIKRKSNSEPLEKSKKILSIRFNDSFLPLFRNIIQSLKDQFQVLFKSNNYSLSYNNYSLDAYLEKEADIKDHIIKENILKDESIDFAITFLGFKKNGLDAFHIQAELTIQLLRYFYTIKLKGEKTNFIKKGYMEQLSSEEVISIINLVGKALTNDIKKKITN